MQAPCITDVSLFSELFLLLWTQFLLVYSHSSRVIYGCSLLEVMPSICKKFFSCVFTQWFWHEHQCVNISSHLHCASYLVLLRCFCLIFFLSSLCLESFLFPLSRKIDCGAGWFLATTNILLFCRYKTGHIPSVLSFQENADLARLKACLRHDTPAAKTWREWPRHQLL